MPCISSFVTSRPSQVCFPAMPLWRHRDEHEAEDVFIHVWLRRYIHIWHMATSVYAHLATSVYRNRCRYTTIHYYIYSIIQYAHQALPLPPTPRHECQHKWPPRPDECRTLCWYTYISTCIIIHYNIHIVMQYAIVRRYYIYLDLYIALVNAHARARARARALSLSLSLSHTPAEPLASSCAVCPSPHSHTHSLSFIHTHLNQLNPSRKRRGISISLHTHTHSVFFTHTHTHTHTPAQPLARIAGYVNLLTYTHTLSLFCTHTHTHTSSTLRENLEIRDLQKKPAKETHKRDTRRSKRPTYQLNPARGAFRSLGHGRRHVPSC